MSYRLMIEIKELNISLCCQFIRNFSHVLFRNFKKAFLIILNFPRNLCQKRKTNFLAKKKKNPNPIKMIRSINYICQFN